MAYTYDASDSINLLKEGEYEVFLDSAEVKILPSGKQKLVLAFRVRSDVEQNGKNRIVFEDIWEEKDNPGYFNRRRINQLLGTQEIEDGTTFETINDIIEFLDGAFLKIKVGVELDTYRGEDKNVVNFYKKTSSPIGKIKNETEGEKEKPSKAEGVITNEDLPF